MSDVRNVTAQELVRRLKKMARKQGLPIEFSPGKGDHMKVRMGERLTVFPGTRGELSLGTLRAICRQLGVDPKKL